MEKITVNEYISEETKQVSERIMRMIEEGKLRNHKLSNTAAVHHGDLEERELGNNLRFLSTRNFYNAMFLCGQVDYK